MAVIEEQLHRQFLRPKVSTFETGYVDLLVQSVLTLEQGKKNRSRGFALRLSFLKNGFAQDLWFGVARVPVTAKFAMLSLTYL